MKISKEAEKNYAIINSLWSNADSSVLTKTVDFYLAKKFVRDMIKKYLYREHTTRYKNLKFVEVNGRTRFNFDWGK